MDALDALLESKGLGILSTVVDVVLVALAAWAAIVLLRKVMKRVVQKQGARLTGAARSRFETACHMTSGVLRTVILFVAGAVILGELGLQKMMTSMLAAAGIGGVALGIGAQSLIGDMAAGFFMLMGNELNIGEYVRIDDVEGIVEELTLRTVSLRGLQGELYCIHCGKITCVTNYSRGDYVVLAEIGVAYEADVSKARSLMLEEAQRYAQEHPEYMGEGSISDLGISLLGASGVTLRLAFPVQPMRRWQAQRDLMQRFKLRFDAEGIEIPYNKLVVLQDDSATQA